MNDFEVQLFTLIKRIDKMVQLIDAKGPDRYSEKDFPHILAIFHELKLLSETGRESKFKDLLRKTQAKLLRPSFTSLLNKAMNWKGAAAKDHQLPSLDAVIVKAKKQKSKNSADAVEKKVRKIAKRRPKTIRQKSSKIQKVITPSVRALTISLTKAFSQLPSTSRETYKRLLTPEKPKNNPWQARLPGCYGVNQ